MAESLVDGLVERGFDALTACSSRDAVALLEREIIDALVTDLRMPHVDGLELLRISRKLDSTRPVIVMTAYSAIETAIESIRQGAYHYLTKPFTVEELVLFLDKALAAAKLQRETIALRRALRQRDGLSNIIGRNGGMSEVCGLIERVADADSPVLIAGETGTGKGVVARAIHTEGRRARAPFVSVNCAALPESLLESELFGHVKGAFTGATMNRTGLFVEADGGTLLLDEIGETSPAFQAKLLHVIESGTVRAVGANKERRVDVRILAATHRDLRERVASERFREDLLYRLDVVTIALPPLRHRRADLPALIEYFLQQVKAKHPRSPVESLSADALERMQRHSWPGNVRELEHVVERAVLLGRSPVMSASDLPESVSQPPPGEGRKFSGEVVPIRRVQREYAAWAFEQLGGRKLMTAEKLGVDFKTLSRWLERRSDADDD
jgi:two-component system response regulator HydG